MHKPISISLCLILLNLVSSSQIDSLFPSIDKTSLPEAKFKEPRSFTGESLSEYMNGGALLYREYGCLNAWVNEISFMKGKYKVEIFRMYSPVEAFGIFSASREKCNGMPPLSSYTCQTKFHLQICRGRYYISIINEKGSQADSVASIKIGEAIVSKISEPDVELSTSLPGYSPELIRHNAVLVKGKLGLQNGAPDNEVYFKDAVYDAVVILPLVDKYVLSVKFGTPDDIMKFATLHNWKTESASNSGNKMTSGENVRIISETHILIEIPR
jgi:hypothetical protein